MELHELPLKIMNAHISEPRQDALDFLEGFFIPTYICKKYQSLEDQADAFDGAFTGFHIHAHLSRGADKETWLDEVLGWYDIMEQRNFKGPFFDGLQATLEACGLGDFYKEAIDYIERQEGKLE